MHDEPEVADTRVRPPERIGPYTIEAELGRGGMAVVYRARRDGPVRQVVALKVLAVVHPGSDWSERFALERDAIERLDHRNVARLLDAGSDAHGRPFLAMELVDGPDLLEYCRRAGLGQRARLQLFVQVGRGVHHAHTRGVLHRDLKPSNVLVADEDGVPVPRVIDFGIARLLQARGDQPATEAGRRVGTAEYASPEQAGDLPHEVDVRSDVYALGVVLHELLAGALPWRGAPPDRRHPVSLREHRPGVDDELACIVGKAIEFEPARRFANVAELVEDVERHLDGRLVLARPPSNVYLLRKFAGRHRGAIALTVVALAGLLASVYALAAGTERTRQEQLRAEAAAVALGEERDRTRARLAEVEQFTALLTDVLMQVHPSRLGTRATFPAVLRAAADRLERDPPESSYVRAWAAHAVAEPLYLVGEHQRSGALLEPGLPALRADEAPESRRLLVQTLLRLGSVASRAREGKAAEQWFDEAAVVAARTGDPGLVFQARGAVAQSLAKRGEFEQARQELVAMLEGPSTGVDVTMRASAHSILGLVLGRMGFAQESLQHCRIAYDLRRGAGDRDPARLEAGWQLGRALIESGDFAGALHLLEQNHDEAVAALGADHKDVLSGEVLVHYAIARSGDSSAVPRLRVVVQRCEQTGMPAAEVAFLRGYLVGALLCTGAVEVAIGEADELVAGLTARLGVGSIDVVQLQLQVGTMFSALGAAEQSLPILLDAYEQARASPGATAMVPRIALAIAWSHHRLGEPEERQRWLEIAQRAEAGR